MDSNGWEVHRLGKLEFWSACDPLTKHALLCKSTLTLRGRDETGEALSLRICFEDFPPIDQFSSNLKGPRMQALWLIAEGDLLPKFGRKGFPSHFLAEKLNKSAQDIRKNVIKPLEERHLICIGEKRLTTLKAHDRKHPQGIKGCAEGVDPTKLTARDRKHRANEKPIHLERTNLRHIFFILLDYFNRHNFNDLTWKERYPATWKRENRVAGIRFQVLARLQRELDKYEKSSQYYVDRGIDPPRSLLDSPVTQIPSSRH